MKSLLPRLVFAALLAAGPAQAKGSSHQGTFVDRVMEVGTDSITVQTAAHSGPKVTHADPVTGGPPQGPSNIRHLKVGPLCEITVDGLPGKLGDIKGGMGIVFRQGMDPDTAGAINAHTIPPPVPPATAIPNAKNGKKQAATHSAFQKIASDVVLDFSPTRITVGTPGGKEARAYYVTPATTITIDGAKATGDAVHLDMRVEVQGDGTRAGVIRLQSSN